MEGNRDESERCIELGLKYMNASNFEKAQKFFNKADQLYPTPKAKELLTKLNQNEAAKRASSKSSPEMRRRNVGAEKTQAAPKLGVDFTSEQSEVVNNINKCKNFYQILGVTKSSTDSEIKKAYKKLALQLHPDKNKAPGAMDAFKALSNAFTTLTDVQKRKQYDMISAEEQENIRFNRTSNGHSHSGYQQSYNRRFESDFTPEELFNIFFGGAYSQQQTRRRYTSQQQQPNAQQQQEPTQSQPSLAFGLILLFIMVSMLSTFFQSDPLYNLQPTSKYSVERRTMTHKIPYYVKENFASEYQGTLSRLENSVEEEYILNMKRACYNEKNYREAMMARAKNFGSKSQFTYAQGIKTPSCDVLYKLGVGRVNY